MSAVSVRPALAADLEAVAAWAPDEALRADLWRDAWTRAVVAVDTTRAAVVGFAMVWTSRVHDGHAHVRVLVRPDLRRRGIGTALVRAAAALLPRRIPLLARGYVGDAELAFAASFGSRTIQVVPPAEIRTDAREVLRPDASVVSGQAVVAARSVGLAALGDAWALAYEWTHADWSPVAPGFADALTEDFADEVDLDATAVALDAAGSITAVSVVFTDVSPPILCAETTARDTPDGERLVEACVRASLDTLAARGVPHVEFDGHVSDPHFHPVWTHLAPTGRWFHLTEFTP